MINSPLREKKSELWIYLALLTLKQVHEYHFADYLLFYLNRWPKNVFHHSRWTGFFSTTRRPTTPLEAHRWLAGSDPIWWQISWALRSHSAPSPASLIMPAISFSRSWSTRKHPQKFGPQIKMADMNWSTSPRRKHSWRTPTPVRKRAWRSESHEKTAETVLESTFLKPAHDHGEWVFNCYT